MTTSSAPPRLPGVLLTGGASRRLGTDKARLLRADGTTLAQHAAAVLAAVCGRCVEVGPGASALPAVREDPPGDGPLAALLTGFAALVARDPTPAPDAVVVLACDYPHIEADHLSRLVAAPGRSSSAAIAAAGGRLHYVCARYPAPIVAEARSRYAAGERSLRWVEAHEHVAVDFGDDVLADVDTPADLARLRRLGLRLDPSP